MNLSPKQIVTELDKYIIGQNEAKKAVAIALRNRYRSSMLSIEEMEEITPKNIIMSMSFLSPAVLMFLRRRQSKLQPLST